MENYSAVRRLCLRKLIAAYREKAALELEDVREDAIGLAGDVVDDVQKIFDDYAGEGAFESLPTIITALKDKEVAMAMEMEPTDDELGDLASACQKLWTLDYNRLEAGAEFIINFQDDTRGGADAAESALFSYVSGRSMNQPTITTFYNLLDNYVSHAGESEEVTDEEASEIRAFLDAIMSTAVMQYTYKYLKANGKIPHDVDDEESFKVFLYRIWFFFYSKEAKWDSSGFEHVFIGDVRHDKVGGMHNWIQLLVEERRGNLNYLGFIPSRGVDGDEVPGSEYVMSISFEWKGVRKSVGSSFFGTSPEFEFALYTMCFLAGKERNPVKLADRYNIDVVCYTFAGDKIGTCYPHVRGMDDDE